MPIRTIEVICVPCEKCERAIKLIRDAVKQIEMQYKTKIIYEFKQTPSLANITQFSLNASQAPAIIINGHMELCGRFEAAVIKAKLEQFHRS